MYDFLLSCAFVKSNQLGKLNRNTLSILSYSLFHRRPPRSQCEVVGEMRFSSRRKLLMWVRLRSPSLQFRCIYPWTHSSLFTMSEITLSLLHGLTFDSCPQNPPKRRIFPRIKYVRPRDQAKAGRQKLLGKTSLSLTALWRAYNPPPPPPAPP